MILHKQGDNNTYRKHKQSKGMDCHDRHGTNNITISCAVGRYMSWVMTVS